MIHIRDNLEVTVMRIIFIRHGHPDYKNDCLTELGHRHAEAAAQRLYDEKIERIYSSSCGRAVETAQHIADKFGLDVEKCEFMREINWGSLDDEPIPHKGHPWYTADDMAENGESIMSQNWDTKPPFSMNKVVQYVKMVGEDFDRWLRTLGYEREGEYYRVGKSKYDTIVMSSHGGSSSAVFSHIFNLPFPFVCNTIRLEYTSITIVSLSNEEGKLVSPRFEVLNESRHIAGLKTENVYGK